MPKNRNILTVFLASPNDLANERLAVRDVVQELNESLRDIGWHIELLGWEDTIPGAGRPQEIINRDVDSCHLFFGMLWKRWGTPTGQYSSGFEEEYTRVMLRRAETTEPEIMLVFKAVDAGDPGTELQKVLEFQQERVEKRDVLFDRFQDEDSLKRKLRTWLTRHIYKIDKELAKVEAGDAKPATPTQTTVEEAKGGNDAKDDPQSPAAQIVDASNSIIEFYGNSGDLDAEAATRLQLFVSAVTSNTITSESLPVHFANLVFLKRLEYRVTRAEVMLLLRTLIESTGENIPGWYWAKDWTQSELFDYIVSLSVSGNDESLRLAAVRLIAVLATPGDDESSFATIYEVLDDESEKLRIEAIDLIATHASIEAVEVIDELLNDPSSIIRSKSASAKLKLLLRHDPSAAVSLMQAPDFATQLPSDNEPLASVFGGLDDETLIGFLDNKSAEIVSAAIDELELRNNLTEDLIRPLLLKSETQIRNRVFRFLVDNVPENNLRQLITELPASEHWWPYFTSGKDYPEINRTRSRAYARLESGAIPELDYYSFETSHIIRGLGEKSPEIAVPLIREMLDDDFDAFRENSGKQLAQKFDQTNVDAIINPDYLYKDQLIEACLAVLTSAGDSEDAKFGRKYILSNNEGVQLESIYLLSKFGDSSDADLLNKAITTGKLATPAAAAQALIETSDNKAETILSLLKLEDTKVIALAISRLAAPGDVATEDLLMSLLRDTRDEVRLVALEYFIRTKDEEYLTELLATYTAQKAEQGYYYNVVHWLDGVLYGPENLKAALKTDIANKSKQEFPDLTNPYH
ncbi:MAG TPA: DUF4062 domain-containing protein [Pyrinomonadaceae bacterium]|nr:DUF4062 domain-containing protein [Pyrinomonadaceae bacterium]